MLRTPSSRTALHWVPTARSVRASVATAGCGCDGQGWARIYSTRRPPQSRAQTPRWISLKARSGWLRCGANPGFAVAAEMLPHVPPEQSPAAGRAAARTTYTQSHRNVHTICPSAVTAQRSRAYCHDNSKPSAVCAAERLERAGRHAWGTVPRDAAASRLGGADPGPSLDHGVSSHWIVAPVLSCQPPPL